MRTHLNSTSLRRNESGFTIIETIIAALVFSIILLVMTIGINNFLVNYYNASINSSVQDTISTIASTIQQSVEYSHIAPVPTAPSGGNPGYLCTGNEEFAFFLGQNTADGVPYVLEQKPTALDSCPIPTSAANWGTSLVGSQYRLVTFTVAKITNTPSEWVINIKLAYSSGGTNGTGDDLLCSPSLPENGQGGCGPNATTLTTFTKADTICKTGSGSRFCAVSGLQSTVERRLN